MQRIAPLGLSEPWDNTGLLLGDPHGKVSRLMTCLTLTPESVAEAIEGGAQMVIVHHPLPFKPLAKITSESYTGALIWSLATSGISVYSPHTAWDSACHGINARLARLLLLEKCQPLVPADQTNWPGLGAGRMGELSRPMNLVEIIGTLSAALPGCRPRGVEPVTSTINQATPVTLRSSGTISRVAICCGSGGSLLSHAVAAKCDLFLTGEATFHNCLEAQAAGIGLLLIGHFASERFAMEQLAKELSADYTTLFVWASQSERDPVKNFDC